MKLPKPKFIPTEKQYRDKRKDLIDNGEGKFVTYTQKCQYCLSTEHNSEKCPELTKDRK